MCYSAILAQWNMASLQCTALSGIKTYSILWRGFSPGTCPVNPVWKAPDADRGSVLTSHHLPCPLGWSFFLAYLFSFSQPFLPKLSFPGQTCQIPAGSAEVASPGDMCPGPLVLPGGSWGICSAAQLARIYFRGDWEEKGKNNLGF